tara:strand:+ start:265 stop:1212 length:948 start_codon:yes stop_codon:yes gene_type:complete
MTTSFSALKKSRSSSFDKLNQQLQKMNTQGGSNSEQDEFWKLEVDKAGNGYAVLRFLPAPKGEDMPFVRMWDHGFQGPGGWYIENSLTTINQDDPVSEYNSKLWNSGVESDKDIARKQKRRLNYIANVYVVKDPTNPQNEGKVFKYKFGKKIFDKLNDVMNPQFEDENPANPFDFWEGADFKLKARNVEGYRNYDKSEFSPVGQMTNPDGEDLSDEALESLWETQYSLQDLVAPKNFKTYDELKAKLYKVLALDSSDHAPQSTAEDDEAEMNFQPKFKSQEAPKQPEAPSPLESRFSEESDDDALAMFKSLANDD